MGIDKFNESSNIIKKALQDNNIKRPVQGTADFFINKREIINGFLVITN